MGRPPVDKPLTDVERNKRYRQRKRGDLPNEKGLTDAQIIKLLRAENRDLRKALRIAEADFSRHAQRAFNDEVNIRSLTAQLERLQCQLEEKEKWSTLD